MPTSFQEEVLVWQSVWAPVAALLLALVIPPHVPVAVRDMGLGRHRWVRVNVVGLEQAVTSLELGPPFVPGELPDRIRPAPRPQAIKPRRAWKVPPVNHWLGTGAAAQNPESHASHPPTSGKHCMSFRPRRGLGGILGQERLRKA